MNRLVGLALAAAMLVVSCDGGPRAGDLVLELTTPTQNDGAVSFSITVPEGDEVVALEPACAGCQAFMHPMSATEIRGVVIGPLPAGAIARLTVSDVGAADGYRVAIREVALRTFSLTNPAAYRLTLVVP